MSDLILAIDQGTTNTKALLVGNDGQPVFRASAPLTLVTPQPGMVEQDPEALWQSVLAVIRECIAHSGADRIKGIAISNQRETAVAWYRADARPAANAISWQCRRGEAICGQLASHRDIIRERTGLPLDPLVSASKWGWLLQQNPALRSQAEQGDLCLGNVDAWLIYKLTDGATYVTDHTNASRTALLNLQTLQWDGELLDLFGIPHTTMPQLACSSSLFGTVSAIPELVDIPIISAIGDSHAAMVGHGSYTPGTIKATYGTGSSLMTLTPGLPAPTRSLARTIAWSHNGTAHFALEGNITMTGSAVQWVGEFLGLADPTRDAVALAERVSNAASVYFVPAMVGLGAPHWDSAARGTLTGLSHTSRREHMARAAVDAIAYQVADVFHAMRDAAGVELPTLHTDGGATRNGALMQFQADLLQVPVHRSSCEDLSALGAAWLGGLTLGWWHSVADLASLPQESVTFLPGTSLASHYDGWKLAVQQARLKGELA
ncbi:FGGY family carbohydrate kinase [Terriglobus albidus]|uniref:FGGY family carbohydrate kinase n=1 Tax=Terriglobus albidus TaxID=1592106 RepID=UPI0021DFF83E|nr:FGGY family carbohydrate kinase [Terriglobus albidus]